MLVALNSALLFVSNVSETARFYTTLGFRVDNETDQAVVLRLGSFTIQCFDEAKVELKKDAGTPVKGSGVFFYLLAQDVDQVYTHVIEAGLHPSSQPRDWPWGNREFAIRDPDGYKLVIYRPL